MPYTPLTEEQFNKAKASGFSTDQIIQFEKKRKSESDSASMFKTVDEGRKATKTLENEQSTLKDAASWPGFIRNQIVGGINTGLNTASFGLTDLPYKLLGTTNVPQGTSDVAKGVGMGVGMLTDPFAATAKAAGNLLGKPVQAVGRFASQGIKDIKDYGRLTKTMQQEAENVGAKIPKVESISRKMKDIRSTKVEPLKQAIENEKAKISDIKESLDAEKGQLPRLKDLKKSASERIGQEKSVAISQKKKEINDLQKVLKSKYGTVVTYLKNVLPDKIKQINRVYGDTLDNIEKKMSESNFGITNADIHNINEKTIQELDEMGINSGKMRSVLEGKFSKSQKLVEGEETDSGLVDNLGFPIREAKSSGQDTVPLREFLSDSRTFRRMLSESQRSGAKGLNDEQIVSAIYNKNVNEFLGEKIPEIRNLQKDYSPVINAMKAARKVFKPGMTYDDAQGVSMLKQYANGNITGGKEQLLKDIQESSRFGEGVTGISNDIKDIRNIGQRIQGAKKSFERLNAKMQDKMTSELSRLEKDYNSKVKFLTDRASKSENMSQMQIDNLKSQITELNRSHARKVSELKDISDEIAHLSAKGKKVGAVGLAALGTSAAGEGLRRLWTGAREARGLSSTYGKE